MHSPFAIDAWRDQHFAQATLSKQCALVHYPTAPNSPGSRTTNPIPISVRTLQRAVLKTQPNIGLQVQRVTTIANAM